MLKLRSSIKKELMKKVLWRGTLLAGIGILILLVAGSTMPVSLLKIFGIPLLILSFSLTAFGLLPYRKLAKLELHPHEIVADEEALIFAKEGNPLFIVPHGSIKSLTYVEKKDLYGFALVLNRPFLEKIKILQPRFDLESFLCYSQEHFECDLFFPYFTERAWKEWEEEKL